MEHWLQALRKGLTFGACGAAGAAVGVLLGEVVISHGPRASLVETVVDVGAWFGLIGALVAAGILAGYDHFVRGGLHAKRLGGLALGSGLGLLAGMVAGGIAQFVFGAGGAGGQTEGLRIICWGIAGTLLGLGLGLRIPNLGVGRGALGGGIGGLLGGVLFVAIALTAGAALARLLGVAVIGFCIGLMIMLIEAALREAWVEIAYGPKETRSVSLGARPVSLGSDPACTVFVRDVAPVALCYRLEQGRVLLEEGTSGRHAVAAPGDQRQLGRLTVTVRAAGRAAGSQEPVPVLPAPTPLPADTPAVLTLRLNTGAAVRLAAGVRLRRTDVPGLPAGVGEDVLGEVLPHPTAPAVLGLKNLSGRAWDVTLPTGERLSVEPRRSVRVVGGTTVRFGEVEGTMG
jgi:hypothetical protein